MTQLQVIEGETEDGLYSGLAGFQNGVSFGVAQCAMHIAVIFSSVASRIQRCTFW